MDRLLPHLALHGLAVPPETAPTTALPRAGTRDAAPPWRRSVLDARVRSNAVTTGQRALLANARSAPVLCSERASRQLSLPFFAQPGLRPR